MPKLHPVFSMVLMLVTAAFVRNIEAVEFLGIDFGLFDAAGISALRIAGAVLILALLLMAFTHQMERR